MAEPKFGPAGNSESFAAAGFKKSEDAPAWLAQMGLTAFEYQCGRGVRCGEETALKIGAAAEQHGIQLCTAESGVPRRVQTGQRIRERAAARQRRKFILI